MKIKLNEDINSYSYTGPGFANDNITLFEFSGEDGYGELSKDGEKLFVYATSYTDDSYDFYSSYDFTEIDQAVVDFNREADRYGEPMDITYEDVENVLKEKHIYIDDYLSGGFYDRLKNSKTREETNKVFDDYREIMKDRGEL